MASTYSTSLRLELMATGDQSGTWGVTTNTNLGTLLEQAITGVLSVAEGDTTLTLTTTNGGSDQARNAVVNLTGAMTANRNVVVQTAAKVYLIKNSTTGGFNITAKTAAGTGVEIAPGTARWVYSDGTNVVDGQPGLVVGYTTTATTAGTTTLTYGSTYYQYFTGSTTQTITLPVASTMTLGQPFYIVNLSSGALTINSSGGNLVATIAASSSAIVQCILTSGTSAASWNAITVNLSAYLPLAGGTMTGQLINTGSTVNYTPLLLTSTEAAAAVGPIVDLYRDSASPAASDLLAQLIFNGRDSAANKQEYASIQATIVSPTSTSEASTLDFYTFLGGSRVQGLSIIGPNASSNNHLNGYTTTATAAGTTTLTVSSTQQQYFTGSTTQTVVLPVTSTLQFGFSYRVVNNSTGAVTVNSSGGNTIAVVAAGTACTFTCILTSGTTAASWDFKFGSTLTLGVNTATTSGTTVSYTSVIPAWANRITMSLSQVSTSGTSALLCQLGTGGTYTTTGYSGGVDSLASATGVFLSVTAGLGIERTGAGDPTDVRNGVVVFTRLSGNRWAGVYNGTILVGISAFCVGSTSINMGGVADSIRLIATNGTDTFDAGNANIIVE